MLLITKVRKEGYGTMKEDDRNLCPVSRTMCFREQCGNGVCVKDDEELLKAVFSASVIGMIKEVTGQSKEEEE